MAPKLGYWKIRGVVYFFSSTICKTSLRNRYGCCSSTTASNLMISCTCVDPHRTFAKNHGLMKNSPWVWTFQILTQSDTILRYVAESNGMGGTNPKERATLSMLNGTVDDLRWTYLRAVYSSEFEKLKPQLLSDLPNHLNQFDRYLSGRIWLSGEKVDYPDFNLYDLLDTLKALEPTCLDNYPRLKKYLTDFEALPQISAYMKSPR
ncbi:glutathione S-transferase, partial [Clonorchis sinensis]